MPSFSLSQLQYRAAAYHDTEMIGPPSSGLQRSIQSFAYPRCLYSGACPEAARKAGYTVAVTSVGLGGWRQFELTREAIDSLDGRIGFALKSRRLFWPLRESTFGRVARAAVRPVRHRQPG